ncbi:MAG: hypothetical protein ACREP9_21415 [Candidatus Dormibacteraceae bacterium]
MRFTGTLRDVNGQPRTGVVGITFAIYTASSGGQRLWQETQNVKLDRQGHYQVMLGAESQGLPLDLFSSGEPRWLGVLVQLPNEEEQPRALLVSVPYALKAADADTLGGLPASAFLKASPGPAPVAAVSASPLAVTALPVASADTAGMLSGSNNSMVPQGAKANTVPKFTASRSLANSQITDTNGVVGMKNLANILFAEQFSDGVPGAVEACPDSGCIIYALSAKVNRNLGHIDPGGKAIALYLGPYTFNVQQITLRSALKIIGVGASGGVLGSVTCSAASPCHGTTLQSVNGSVPVFVLPQVNHAPATNVLLSGFRLLGAPGNVGQGGFFLDTSSLVNAGLWYATLDDIHLEDFSGIGLHLRGPNNNFGALNQWIDFKHVVVFRTSNGGNALRIEGGNFEMHFENCQFDGQAAGDGVNIYVGGLAGGTTAFPLNITFQGLVSQGAATAVQIDGANSITFHESHHEKLWGGYLISSKNGIGAKGVTIADAAFEGDVGVNAGSGYLLNVATTVASGIVFTHNQIYGNPDSVVIGTNLAQVVYQDNQYSGSFTVPPTSGITTQLSPGNVISIGGVHSVGLNPSATPIATIQSALGPGEMVTFFSLGGEVTFASGGNINLMGSAKVEVNGSITFVRNDLTGGLQWTPVSQWTGQ